MEQCLSSKEPKNTVPADKSLELIQDRDEFVQKFQTLYNSELFSDIVLKVGDNRFYAHKFLLITASEVFEAMLGGASWQESNQAEVTLTEDEECAVVFPDFLSYIYSGTVSLTTSKVHALLVLADKYSIKVLRKSCIDYMARHIVESPCTNRTLTWYHYATMTESEELQQKCAQFIRSNFNIISKASDWLMLSVPEMIGFLKSSDIFVKSEYTLWQEVERWLIGPENASNIKTNLEQILPLIRFSMMTPKELWTIENSQLHKDHLEMFSEPVMKAHRLHSLLSDETFNPACPSDEYRNYFQENYKICADLVLPNYNTKGKSESDLKAILRIPHQFYASGIKNKIDKNLEFGITFYTKGFFYLSQIYSSMISRQNDLTSLKVEMLSHLNSPVKVKIVVLLFGHKNGITYVAHSTEVLHTFTRKTDFCHIQDVIDLKKLIVKESLYLVHGSLKAKVFIKFQRILKDEKVEPSQ